MLRKFLVSLRPEKEILFLSIFISSCLLRLYYAAYSFELSSPKALFISQATQDGVDIGGRINFYYSSILYGSILCVLLYIIFFKVLELLKIGKPILQMLAIFSVTGFVLIIMDVMDVAAKASINLMFILVVLTFFLQVISKVSQGFKVLRNTHFLSILYVLSFLVTTWVQFLFCSNEFITHNYILLYVLVLFLLALCLLISNTKMSLSSALHFCKPLAFIPIILFVSVECLFYCKEKYGFLISYKWVSIVLFILMVIFFTTKHFISSKKGSSEKLLTNYFVPSALICFVLLSFYNPVLPQSHDFFELANPANAQMRIFKFHEIPCIDFMSSHMLSEQFYGIIYHLIFGYHGNLNFMVYEFMYLILFYLLAYKFCKKIFRYPPLALLFLISFPYVENLFNIHLFFAIVIFYACRNLIQHQSVKNYLLLFFGVFFLLLWRLDTGSAALMVLPFFLPLLFLLSKTKISANVFWKALVVFFGILLSGLMVLFLFRSPTQLLSNFQAALQYLTANQAHGYSSLGGNIDQHFFIFYLLIPTCSLLFIILLVGIWWQRVKEFAVANLMVLQASIFFYLLVLTNFQRGLVRHNFMEGNDSFLVTTFYLASALLILFLCNIQKSISRYIVFFISSFVLVLVISYFPLSSEPACMDRALSHTSILQCEKAIKDSNLQGRIIMDKEFANQNYTDFNNFLNKNLTSDQTFFDFSNSPMMYYYCQRSIPSYFCQNQQNAISMGIQKRDVVSMHVNKVPVVIYLHTPIDWYDAADGVPNNLRQYYYAEFVYKNYKPCSIIDGRSIWIDKGMNCKWVPKIQDSMLEQAQTHDYKMSAMFIDRYYKHATTNHLNLIAEGEPVMDSNKNFVVSVPKEIIATTGIFAEIKLMPLKGKKEIRVHIMSNGVVCGTYTFDTNEKEEEYMIRLSNQYLWYTKPISQLIIDKGEGLSIKSIRFLKDE